MKKLFLLFFFLFTLSFYNLAFSASLTTIYGGGPNEGTDCGSSSVPRDSDTYKSGTSYTCNTHNYYSSSDYEKSTSKGTMTMCDGEDRVIGKNGTKIKCRKYDDTRPSISATNSSSSRRKSDISITLSASDSGGSGLSVKKYRWNNSDCWNGTTFNNGNTITKSTDGSSTLYLCAKDGAGNTQTWNGTYRLDKTLPSGYGSNSSSSWRKSDISITLSASDSGGSGLSKYKVYSHTEKYRYSLGFTSEWRYRSVYNYYDGRYRWNNSDCWNGGTYFNNGNKITQTSDYNNILYVCTRDNAGNSRRWSGYYRIDRTSPIISHNYYYSNIWRNGSSKTITLHPKDSLSGIKTTKWCQGSSCNPSTGTIGTNITKYANYNNTIRYQTWDNMGYSSTVGSINLKIDNTKPSISATNSSSSWKKSDISIKLSASDTGGSGLSLKKYRWNNSNCWNGTTFNNGNTITRSTTGSNTLYLCARDGAGNTQTWSGTYKLDKTKPTTSATNSSNSWKYGNITIKLSASDTGGSGLSLKKYRWNNSDCWNGGTMFNNGKYIVQANSGDHTLYLCTKDGAGNMQTWSGKYRIDRNIPSITHNYSYSNIWKNGSSKTITLYPKDSLSGIKTTKWCEGSACNISNGNVGTTITKYANYNNTIRYQTWDNMGYSSTVGSINLKIDNTKPSISATNSSSSWKKSDISIKLSVSDSGGSGLSLKKYRWNNSDCWNGTTFNNGNTITRSTAGNNTLYLCARDGAGNTQTWSGTYKLDNTKPSIGATNSSTTWKNSNISIKLSASDTGGSGLSLKKYRWNNSDCWNGTTFNNGNTITRSTAGNNTLYLCAKDGAGNTQTWSGKYRIDKTKPSISATNSSTTWKNSNISIKLSASDTGGSGLSLKKYRWNNSDCWNGTTFNNGNTITRSTAGNNTLYLCAKDGAGNTQTWSGKYKLDKTKPSISATNSSTTWKNSDISIKLSASDTGGSGLSLKKYRWNNSDCWNGTTFNNGNTITRSTAGNNTLYLCAKDGAGNTQTWSGKYRIDKTKPTVSHNYSYNDTWKNGTRTINLSPSDSGGSGIKTTKWCQGDNCNPSTGTTGTTITKSGNYNNTIRYQTWDNAGNTSSIGSFLLKLDNTKPTVSNNYSYNNIWKNGTRTITLSPSDSGGSGVKTTKWCEGSSCNLSTGTTGTTITKSGNYNNTIRYQTWDNAGNASSTGNFVLKLDNTNPKASADNNSASWKNSDISIKLSVSDTGGSGLSVKKYRWNNSHCWDGTNFNNGNTIIQKTNGSHILYLCAKDGAGNTYTWNGHYKLDKIKPDSLYLNYVLGAIETGSYDITFKAKDTGGSKLSKIELYESDNLGAWKKIYTKDNIDLNDNLFEMTYTKDNGENGHRYKHKIIAYDYANNSTELEETDTVRIVKPLEYEDNDNETRKTINGYVYPLVTKNIFWNNYIIEKYIEDNPNNTDSFNEKLGEVENGFIHLEVSGQAELQLIKVDKERYKEYREFKRLETLTGSINGEGYISIDTGGNLELKDDTTGSYTFDFRSNDYILMLENLETNKVINYSLKGIDGASSKGIYLNPINDSNDNDKGFKILGYDVIINNRGNILGKMIEMTKTK